MTPITSDEVIAMFGDTIPPEAARLLAIPQGLTPDQVRGRLTVLAVASQPRWHHCPSNVIWGESAPKRGAK